MNKQSVNEALRLFRVFHDLRANEMSQKLGISPSYLSEIEHGKKKPSLALLNKYAEIFETKPSSILFFSEQLEKNENGIKKTIANSIISFLQKIEEAKD